MPKTRVRRRARLKLSPKEFMMISEIVDAMLDIEPFLLLTMDSSTDSPLKQFLELNRHVYAQIKLMSRNIQFVLQNKLNTNQNDTRTALDLYKFAIVLLKKTNGFSLLYFLSENKDLSGLLHIYLPFMKIVAHNFYDWLGCTRAPMSLPTGPTREDDNLTSNSSTKPGAFTMARGPLSEKFDPDRNDYMDSSNSDDRSVDEEESDANPSYLSEDEKDNPTKRQRIYTPAACTHLATSRPGEAGCRIYPPSASPRGSFKH